MKKQFLITVAIFGLSINTIFAQDLLPSEVPSVIVNNLHKHFPKASDVEWEKETDHYKVEFETGVWGGTDHEVWFNEKGQVLRHKKEISNSDLPQKVLDGVKASFKNYRINDVKKITEGKTVTYKMELKNGAEEWETIWNSNGKLIHRRRD